MEMLRLIRNITVTVLLFCVPLSIFSEESSLGFDHYTMADGLSQNTVTCIFQDSYGFLWIGTQAGLNRFDGLGFKTFVSEPMDHTSISSSYIINIAEDSQGYIWVATDFGLNRYDRFTGVFQSYFSDNRPGALSDNEIQYVFVDSKDRIWIKTPRALEFFDREKSEFRTFVHFFDVFNPPPKNQPFPIFEDSDGGIWVATNDGLNFFDESFNQFVRYFNREDRNSISNNQIRSIIEDSKGNMWIGTASGLNSFDRKRKRFEAYFFNRFMPEVNTVNAIAESQCGALWLATSSHGLMLFDTSNKLFKSYRHSTNNSASISNNSINALYRDASDILWVGTRSALDKLDAKKKKFELYRRSAFSPYRFSSNDFTALMPIGDSLLVLGTKNKGINIISAGSKELYIIAQDNSLLSDNSINSISRYSADTLLVGTGAGAYLLAAGSMALAPLSFSYIGNDVQRALNGAITATYRDTEGRIWLGTKQGLAMINVIDSSSVLMPNIYNDVNSLSSNEINLIFEDSRNQIWIGTSIGVNMLESISAARFKRYVFEKNFSRGLSNNTVYSIAEDDLGNIWIGTAGGLNKYSPERGEFSYFSERDGLPNSQIYGIVIDNHDMWISTNKGLARMDLNSGTTKSYQISDGLQGYEYNPNSCAISENGQIFFGGINGANAFYTDSIVENRVRPKVVITTIEVVSEAGRFTHYIEGRKSFALPARTHSLTIEFASLEFTQPRENSFRYKMDGADDDWTQIKARNYAHYSNLPPGSYSFKVYASNNDMVWSEEPAELVITIDTPFHKTWLAYILYISIITLSIYLYIEFRTSTLRKANRILTEKQQAALEIEKQKEELSLKNKNITDSINYANRIQTAIMPSKSKFKKLIPDSFILYKPKDIVSGDFYWITEIDEKIFVAAVDCTGHGVPGAFMSIIGFDLLRNITKEKRIHSASEVLNAMNKSLLDLLSKNAGGGEVKDGMDLSLIVMHKDKGYLEFAGAINPLYIIRNNCIEVVAADRFSLGASNEEQQAYTTSIVDIERGDRFYMFSDGYVDQFGGPLGKKMKFRRFRHLLLSIHNLPFDQQEEYLNHYFNTWKGEHEQVDDILLLGMGFDSYLDELEELYD
jgi:ligand-binding sensor domain-containing protein/serine phosphatase RsbU (regulator of sigma subunit)